MDSRSQRPLVAAFIAPALALLAGGARWLLQGTGNLYTSTDQRFYVPDPDLGWRLAPQGMLWLGLDALAMIAAFAAALGVVALLIHRSERRREVSHGKLRTALLAISLTPALIPIAGFAAGTPPASARATAPAEAGVVGEGIEASLPAAPPGVYEVVAHRGTLIAATVKAGGDTFEARFAGAPRGSWRGDPTDLSQPMSGEFFVAAGSVETGIEARDEHAADKLAASEHPELGFALTRITGATAGGERRVRFRGEGEVRIMGAAVAAEITGAVTELDADGRSRQGLDDAPALVVNASFEIDLRQTPVDTAGGTFDETRVPIRVSLVLINRGEP